MTLKKSGWVIRYSLLNLKISGWLLILIDALALVGFLALFHRSGATLGFLIRTIEVILPLALGLHAAFVLSPDNEPAIELLLSYPKSINRLLSDRLLTICLLHGSLALLASVVVAVVWQVDRFTVIILRWLPAALFLIGLAVLTTQLTRQSAFGAMMVTLFWASTMFGADELLKVWRWVWTIHIYLQPGLPNWEKYLLNRLFVTLAGLVLLFITNMLLHNEERTLGRR